MSTVLVPIFYYRRHVADALIDEADAERVLACRWTFEPFGHANRWSPVGKILMHREVLGLVAGDGKVAHHENHDGLDNQRSNLRVCRGQAEHGQIRHPLKPPAPEAPCWQAHNALYFVRRPVVEAITEILGVRPYYAMEAAA